MNFHNCHHDHEPLDYTDVTDKQPPTLLSQGKISCFAAKLLPVRTVLLLVLLQIMTENVLINNNKEISDMDSFIEVSRISLH